MEGGACPCKNENISPSFVRKFVCLTGYTKAVKENNLADISTSINLLNDCQCTDLCLPSDINQLI